MMMMMMMIQEIKQPKYSQHFFGELVINILNKLPDETDFSSLSKFKRTIMFMDLSDYPLCL